MLRVFGAFFSVFCLLGLIVNLDRAAQLFGGAALMLFAIDIALSSLASAPSVSRTRTGNLL
jgi:hypothetical protein